MANDRTLMASRAPGDAGTARATTLPELITAEENIRKRSPIQSKAGAEEFERQLRTSLMTPVPRKRRRLPIFSAMRTSS